MRAIIAESCPIFYAIESVNLWQFGIIAVSYLIVGEVGNYEPRIPFSYFVS